MVDVGSPLPIAPWGSLLGVYLTLLGIASWIVLESEMSKLANPAPRP